jgi:hypothetical protein
VLQEMFSTINHVYELSERKDRFILAPKDERGEKKRNTVKPRDSRNFTGFPKQKLKEYV